MFFFLHLTRNVIAIKLIQTKRFWKLKTRCKRLGNQVWSWSSARVAKVLMNEKWKVIWSIDKKRSMISGSSRIWIPPMHHFETSSLSSNSETLSCSFVTVIIVVAKPRNVDRSSCKNVAADSYREIWLLGFSGRVSNFSQPRFSSRSMGQIFFLILFSKLYSAAISDALVHAMLV